MPHKSSSTRTTETSSSAGVNNSKAPGAAKPAVQPLQKVLPDGQTGEQFSSKTPAGIKPFSIRTETKQEQPAVRPLQARADKTGMTDTAGKERSPLPEAWHVAQQKQDRANMQMKSGDSGHKPLRRDAGNNGLALPSIVQPKFIKTGSAIGVDKGSIAASGQAVTQLLITYSGGKYGKNGDRSGWHANLDKALVKEYNERLGKSLAKIPYDTLKLTRDHIGSFEGLQGYILDYLNSGDDAGFKKFVIDFTAALDKSSDEYANIHASAGALRSTRASGTTGDVVVAANKCLSLLNNLSVNLQAADKYLNSYIQERPDLVFTRNADGSFTLSEHSRNVLAMGPAHWGSVPLTPDHGQRIVTSQGAVPRADLTPTSKQALSGYPTVKVPAKSKNVRSRLYGPSAHSNFRSAPKTKIDLTGSASTSAPPVAATAVPPVTVQPPPPRYTNTQKVFTYPDGRTVWSALDNLTKAATYLLVAANSTSITQDLGPAWTPPPRYNKVKHEWTYQDGTTVWTCLDTHTNANTFLLLNASSTGVIRDLGTGWTPPPRYNKIKHEWTYQDGTTVWTCLDTHTNANTFLLLNASSTTVIRDLGTGWTPPPRYNKIKQEWTYQDGRTIWKCLDTHTNTNTFLTLAANGATVVEDLGPGWTPPRYSYIVKMGDYQQGSTVWKVHDSHINGLTFLYLASDGKILNNLGPDWKPSS